MDFISDNRNTRYLWLKGLSTNIQAEAVKMGLPAPEAEAIQAITDPLLAAMEATNAAQAILDGAKAAEEALMTPAIAALRLKVRGLKALPGYAASGSEGVLKLAGQSSAFDPMTYKPTFKVSIVGGQIRLDFTKKGVDMVAVYGRLRGEAAWRKLGTDSSSPYYDTEPLADPAVPEVREYRLMGMIKDVEIGQPSDILSITLA